MKRTFLILCLITIYTASYANIASTGYVDSVVGSLSTVATSGSYNDLTNKPTIPTFPTKISSFTNDSGYITASYHDSTKQDKLPTGPTDGKKYSLIWNGSGFSFEEFIEQPTGLQCSAGTYDIGFSQCIDPSIEGDDSGYYSHDGSHKNNETQYNLSAGEWAVVFNYGLVKGAASCNDTPGDNAAFAFSNDSSNWSRSSDTFNQNSTGANCWCKITSPAASSWMFFINTGAYDCVVSCADYCANLVQNASLFRSVIFPSVGN